MTAVNSNVIQVTGSEKSMWHKSANFTFCVAVLSECALVFVHVLRLEL